MRDLTGMHPYRPHVQRFRYRVHIILVSVPVGNHPAKDIMVAYLFAVLLEEFLPCLFECPAPATKRVSVECNSYLTRLIIICRALLRFLLLRLPLMESLFSFLRLLHLDFVSIRLPELLNRYSTDFPL